MSRSATTWFAKQSANESRRTISSAPVTIRSGNSGESGRREREINENGKSFFRVGETEIGGEEEVG